MGVEVEVPGDHHRGDPVKHHALQGGGDGGVEGVFQHEHPHQLPVHRAEHRVLGPDARGEGDALPAHKVAVAHQDLLPLALAQQAGLLHDDFFNGEVAAPLRPDQLVKQIGEPRARGPDDRGGEGHGPLHGQAAEYPGTRQGHGAGGIDVLVQQQGCEFTTSAKIREHEKLDGLWESGIKHYPVCGDFPDLYSQTLEAAKKQYVYDDVKAYTTSCIRRFKPLVVVTQDLNGEYGHGGHMLFSHAVAESVETSNDSSVFPESASNYGTWDVPKTYLHLYTENKITMNLRLPLSRMGNRTSIEVQTAAYKKHVSQQWCWFYVSDDYEYSCADFGLYRTTVGNDTGNDMLENITTYEEQERLAKEAAEKESIESSKAAEEASIAKEQQEIKAAHKETSKRKVSVAVIVIIVVIIIGAAVFGYIRLQQSRRKHSRRRR